MRAIPIRMERTNQKLIAAFAEALRNQRLSAGPSQEDLAARADISARHISFLETGRRQPTLTILKALSDGLGTSMGDLVASVEERYRA